MLEPFNILGCRGLVNLSTADFEREVARRGASGEWPEQWEVARVRGKWGELRGEWGVLRQVARDATCSEVVRDLPTSYFPLGSPHSPLTLATSPWSRHSPLNSPLPFSRERALPA